MLTVFFAVFSPASSMANPPCMKSTSTAHKKQRHVVEGERQFIHRVRLLGNHLFRRQLRLTSELLLPGPTRVGKPITARPKKGPASQAAGPGCTFTPLISRLSRRNSTVGIVQAVLSASRRESTTSGPTWRSTSVRAAATHVACQFPGGLPWRSPPIGSKGLLSQDLRSEDRLQERAGSGGLAQEMGTARRVS